MYTEDLIFGPLTFKQFLCFAFGVGLFYFSKSVVPEQYGIIATVLIIAVTILGIIRFQPKKIDNVEEYFASKKIQDPVGYKKMIMKKQAEVQSQIHSRKLKGLPEDPELLRASEMFEKMIEENVSL